MSDAEERKSDNAADNDRKDAAGYDVDLPPSGKEPGTANPGLHDEPSVEEAGWRVSDTNRDFDELDQWRGDKPYPGGQDATEESPATAPTDQPSDEAARRVAPDADLLETVTTLLTEERDLDISNLSVEVIGSTVTLRGSAATSGDRERATEIAGGVEGVEAVDNLLGADD